MQLEKKSKLYLSILELAVMGLCLILNISFLHGAGILDWGYFDMPAKLSGYALYLTSIIGSLAISKRVADLLIIFFKSLMTRI